MDESLLWQTRAFIYKHFADVTRPPTAHETAQEFNISANEAASLFRDLHARHAIFLQPSADDRRLPSILMASPFSAVPTDFKVNARGRTYYANCAWDMLGIPAALHSDAWIEAAPRDNGDPVELRVRDGQVIAEGRLVVHFPLPFARWYDDLIDT